MRLRLRLQLRVLLLAATLMLLSVYPSASAYASPIGSWHIDVDCKTNSTCTVCSYYRVYDADGFTVYLYSDIVCTP